MACVQVNNYCIPTFIAHQRLVLLGRTPKLRWTLGGLLPFVDPGQLNLKGS